MKRLMTFAMVLALAAAVLVGCAPKEPPAPPAPVYIHNNGTFFASSNATARGYMTAEVTIENDKITAVTLVGYGNLATEKDETYGAAAGYTAYHEMKVELPKAFIEKNTWDVDIYTGATSSSNQSKQAVQRAIEKALKDRPAGGKYYDGTFMAMSDVGGRANDWAVVLVTIENDKITEVVINETRNVTNDAGVTSKAFKDAEYSWAEYHEALKELPLRFIAANSAEVDVFTGATGTSTNAMQAVERALELATR